MRQVRILSLLVFIITAAAFGYFTVEQKKTEDRLAPVLICSGDELAVSVQDGEDVLLEGVSAMDNREDISDQIMVESISRFKGDGTRTVNYVVCDAAGNIAACSRTIRYTDYESPVFHLSQPLRFYRSEKVSLLDYVTAEDCLDGDISDQIKILGGESGWDYAETGVYQVNLQVSNRAGDVSALRLWVEYLDKSERQMEDMIFPALSEYLVCIPAGSSFDPGQYLTGVEQQGEQYSFTGNAADSLGISREQVAITSEVDTQTPGTYRVIYTVTDASGEAANTTLHVIVK